MLFQNSTSVIDPYVGHSWRIFCRQLFKKVGEVEERIHLELTYSGGRRLEVCSTCSFTCYFNAHIDRVMHT